MKRFLAGKEQIPKGMQLVGRWHAASDGWALTEADDLTAVHKYTQQRPDMIRFVATPVMDDAETAAVLKQRDGRVGTTNAKSDPSARGMTMKTGVVALGAMAAVIASGAMTGEPRGMPGYEIAFEGDIYIPCLGAYMHGFESWARPMFLLQYDYRLTVDPDGEVVVHRKAPGMTDWTRCIATSH